MKSFSSPKKILWAVDAEQKRSQSFHNITKALAQFARSLGAQIELVYAYHTPKLYLTPETFEALDRPYLDQAQKNLMAIGKELKGVYYKTTIISNTSQPKAQNENQLILSYAQKNRFDMIAVATHGRNVMLKLFLGSFAETLFLNSSLPLLILNPHQKRSLEKPIKKVLFPTDFSLRSKKILNSVLELIKKQRWELCLINGLINPYLPMPLSDAPMAEAFLPTHSKIVDESQRHQKRHLESWLKFCKTKGVEATGTLYTSGGRISEMILQAARKHQVDFIVMASQWGKPSHEGAGSITKKVIRAATVPVLTMKY